jgi:beta-glucosidase
VQPKLLSLYGYDVIAILVNNHDPLINILGISLSRWIRGLQGVNVSGFQLGLGLIRVSPMPNSARRGISSAAVGPDRALRVMSMHLFNSIQQRAINDDTYLLWDFQSQNPNVNLASSACIVFINEFASEGTDRPNLADPGSDGLVQNVANKCRNPILVIHNAGIGLVDTWIDHPNITAVIFAHLPGQDSGKLS